MRINYCDWINGSDSTGDGSATSPFKTIDRGVVGLVGGDECRCAKSSDPIQLSGTFDFTYGSNQIMTSQNLTGVIDSNKTSQRLLLNFNGTNGATAYTSESNNICTFVGQAQLSTADQPFGTASLLLDGTGDYLTFADLNDLYHSVHTGHQTVEEWSYDIWVKSSNNAGTQGVVSQYSDGNNQWFIQFQAGKLRFYHICSSVTRADYTTTNVVLSDTTTWHRLTIVRSGATLKIFWDGVDQALTVSTAVGAFNMDNGTDSVIYVGCSQGAGSNCFFGRIKSLRFHQGYAKYLANFNPSESEPTVATPYFVGKGTDEYWYEVAYATPTYLQIYRRYAGTTESAKDAYYLQMTPTAAQTSDVNVQTIPHGANGYNEILRIKVSGGWNLTNQIQDGWTNFYNLGERYKGRGLFHIGHYANATNTPNYIEFSKMRFIRYNIGVYLRNPYFARYTDITTLECNYGIHCGENYGPSYCVFTRCYMIGGYQYGFYTYAWTGCCWFEGMVVSGYTTQGAYISYTGTSATIDSCTWKDCKFILNRSHNFYDYTYTYNYTQFINCDFNDSLLGGGYLKNQSSCTFPNFVNCKFNRNYNTGCYHQNSTVTFLGCQFNNNLGIGCDLYQSTPHFEGCEANYNLLEGIRHNEVNALRYFSFKHVTAKYNQCGRDIYWYNGVYSPQNASYPTQHLPVKQIEESYLAWSVENLQTDNFRCDFTAGHGPAYANLMQFGTDWKWTLFGIVGKHTGSEARGGSGNCMYVAPWSRYTSYGDQPIISALFKEYQGAVQAELPFRYDSNTNKTFKVWMKKTPDFQMGTVKFAIVANNGKVYYSDNCNLTTDYQQFAITVDKAFFTVNCFYALRILVSAKNEVWNAGRVFIDDFSIEDA
jgi:hypothetical protein